MPCIGGGEGVGWSTSSSMGAWKGSWGELREWCLCMCARARANVCAYVRVSACVGNAEPLAVQGMAMCS